MFGAFRYNEKTKEHDHFNLPDHQSSPVQEREYTRTACDLCRAKKVKCNGEKDECDRCIASSNTCTYTLSSGTGPGRKRLRKSSVVTNTRSNKSSISRSRSPRHPQRKTTTSGHKNGRRTPRTSQPTQSSREAITTGTMIDNSFSSPSDSATTTGWSVPDSEIHHLLNLPTDMEPFSGNEFEFTPGFSAPASLSPDDQSPSGLHMDQVQLSDNYSSLLGLSSSGPIDSAPILLPPPPTRTQSAQDLTNSSHSSEPLSTPTTSGSLSSGQKCGCLCALLYLFEDTGVQITSSRDVATDTLFQCLQRGMQECQAMLSCQECDTRVKNPILLATLGNQLVAIARELVSRFMQCQTGEAAPVVFHFGRYSIKGTGMQTRMLRDMVALHVRDLYGLLDRSKLNIDATPGPLSILENAKLEVNKLHEILSQSLESISSNYN